VRILFGTANAGKVKLIRGFLAGLPVEVLSPADLGICLMVVEDGLTPAENACKKALAYQAAAAGLPTFAIDAGLTIAAFPADKQPGVLVRRVFGSGKEPTDNEILDYYRRELAAVGGTSPGTWQVAVAVVDSASKVALHGYTFEVLFTSQACEMVLEGSPLSSLMQDPATRKYYAEMGAEERPDARIFAEVMRIYLAGGVTLFQ
jgi:inosine/xanthosine triphosphate pyrophosphatase family protein